MVWIIFHHSARIRILEYLRQLLHLFASPLPALWTWPADGFHFKHPPDSLKFHVPEQIWTDSIWFVFEEEEIHSKDLWRTKVKKLTQKGLLDDILGLVGFQALVWSFLGISKGIRSSHVWSIHLGLPTAAVVTCISSRRPEGQDKYLRKMFDLSGFGLKQSNQHSLSSHLGYYVPAYIYLLFLEEIQNWGSE